MIMMQMTGTHLLLFKFALKLELFSPQDSISRIISPTGLNIKIFYYKNYFFLSCHVIDID